ncbi:MAG: hypothetical exported protein [Marine Group I thaumarchaeote]|nr:MAG: hypothetical exported protein [Marine Group I thaumarchaeote]
MLKVWAIIAVFAIGVLIPSSFAQSENLTTKLWFITTNENGCSFWNERALAFYETVTVQYLPMYDLHGTLKEGKCVRDIDVANNYDEFIKSRQSVDLPIIVLDHRVAESQLRFQQNELGHYYLAEGERFGIVFGAFAPFTIEDKDSAWVLSHEISHFALDHKGKPYSMVKGWVHEIQTMYELCEDKQQCTVLWTTVTALSGQLIPVMIPFPEDVEEPSDSPPTPIPEPEPVVEPEPEEPLPPTPSVKEDVIFAFPSEKLIVKENNPVSINGFVMVGLGEENFLPYAKLSLKKYPEGTTISTITSSVFGHFVFDLTGSKNSATYDQNSGTSTWDMYVEFAGDSKNNPTKSEIIRLTVEGIVKSPIIEKNIPKNDVSELELPQWIRNNAKWWSEGQIGEADFLNGIQYMIKNGIMKIPNLPEQATNTSVYKVPDWIKNNAKWWSEGKISDDDFVKGLHFLVDKGIIRV